MLRKIALAAVTLASISSVAHAETGENYLVSMKQVGADMHWNCANSNTVLWCDTRTDRRELYQVTQVRGIAAEAMCKYARPNGMYYAASEYIKAGPDMVMHCKFTKDALR